MPCAPLLIRSALLFFIDASGFPFALILPIKPAPELSRAVKAYFVEPAEDAAALQALQAENESLSADFAALLGENAALKDAAAALAAELEAIKAQPVPPAKCTENVIISEEAPKNHNHINTAVNDAMCALSALPGIVATVRGAQTSAPVIWLSGETDRHKEALSAAGAKWSGKKSAYYIKIA